MHWTSFNALFRPVVSALSRIDWPSEFLPERTTTPVSSKSTATRSSPRSLDSGDASVPRRITTDLLDSIDRDPDLHEEIRRRFEWTLQLDPRYEAIAYAIAFECHSDPIVLRDGMKDAKIQSHARVWHETGFPKFGGNMEFSSLLREMVDLGRSPPNRGRR